MRRSIRRYLSMLLVMLMTVSAAAVICTKNAYAGSFSGGYISLGADLTEEEKSKVLELFGVDEKDLENYKVVYVTNKEEHQYLDSYISSAQIGDYGRQKGQRHQCDNEECYLLYNRYVCQCAGDSRCGRCECSCGRSV